MEHKHFGSCCKDLADAMNDVPNPLFHVEENGVLFLTVGYVMTENGPGWFDQAALFCPYCGGQLQTLDEIRARTSGPLS